MPGLQPVSFTTPYSAEEADIERRRQMAQLLQQQGQEPMGGTEMVGGWAIPKSPWEGIGKAAQQMSGAYQNKKLDERQKALVERYQSDYQKAMATGLRQLQGSPAQTIQPDPQEAQQSADYGTPPVGAANIPGQPADPMAALATFSSHPQAAALAPMAMQAIQEARLKAMVDQLRGGGTVPAGTPGMSPATSQGAFGTPQFANGSQGGNPLEGLNPNALPFMTSTIPGAGEIGKALQSTYAEAHKPINVREGGAVYVPGSTAPMFQNFKTQPGQMINYGSGGPTMGQVPGFAPTTSANANIPLPNAPMQTVKLSNQRELQLTQPEYLQYTNSGGQVLPSRYQGIAQEIPGMRFSDAGGAPQPRVQSPAGFPRETPTQNAAGWEGRARTLNAELAQEQERATSATTPEERQQAQGNIAAIQKELGGVPKGTQPPAVVGATQSQEEQVQQARQTAAGKGVDEEFAKEYVKFTQGGAQDAAKQIAQLKDVQSQLATPGANLTGTVVGNTPNFALNVFNPKAVAMKERVEEVVQRSLRSILGAQFTENEGERLIARAYNPRQPEAENLIRVNRLTAQLEQAFKAKQDAAQYFEKNGTLMGWQGKLPSFSDFDPGQGPQRAGGPIGQNEGKKAVSKSGKPMTFRNGRWEYDG